jgi:hypothetical protein
MLGLCTIHNCFTSEAWHEHGLRRIQNRCLGAFGFPPDLIHKDRQFMALEGYWLEECYSCLEFLAAIDAWLTRGSLGLLIFYIGNGIEKYLFLLY